MDKGQGKGRRGLTSWQKESTIRLAWGARRQTLVYILEKVWGRKHTIQSLLLDFRGPRPVTVDSLWRCTLMSPTSLVCDPRGSSVMLMFSRLNPNGDVSVYDFRIVPQSHFLNSSSLLYSELWLVMKDSQEKDTLTPDETYKKNPDHNSISFKRKMSWSRQSLNEYPNPLSSLHALPPTFTR